jgi:ribose 5-phosphate isomerase B
MKIAVGSDQKRHLTDVVIEDLRKREHELVLFGPIADQNIQWTDVALQVAESVISGRCKEGILFCLTGTGVTIAANKVPGIRAALCFDAWTAKGARLWNHANVLVMSLRLTTEITVLEILDAWFNTPFGIEETQNVAKIELIEKKYRN